MTRYALNSAVLTAFGTYEYEPLNRMAAREWWEAGPVVATIGYEETCIAMERVLGIPRPRVNRRTIEMDPGDERGERRRILQADQCVYVYPGRARLPQAGGIVVGEHDLPDVVLEVDHTTTGPASHHSRAAVRFSGSYS